MTVYLVDIETQKFDGSNTLGPFTTFEKAKQAARTCSFLRHWTDEKLDEYDDFDSNWEEGRIYTEDYCIEVFERELE